MSPVPLCLCSAMYSSWNNNETTVLLSRTIPTSYTIETCLLPMQWQWKQGCREIVAKLTSELFNHVIVRVAM